MPGVHGDADPGESNELLAASACAARPAPAASVCGQGYRGRLAQLHGAYDGGDLSWKSFLSQSTWRMAEQRGPACFCDVLGAVLASCIHRDRWSPELVAALFAHLCTASPTLHETWAAFASDRPYEEAGEEEDDEDDGGIDLTRIFPSGLSPRSYAYLGDDVVRAENHCPARRRRAQIGHPAWDLRALVRELVQQEIFDASEEARLVGLVSELLPIPAQAAFYVQYYCTSSLSPPMRHRSWDGHFVLAKTDSHAIARLARASSGQSAEWMLGAVRVLLEQVCAEYDTGGECIQPDDEFAFTEFMQAWASAAGFPLSFSPAARSALIEPLASRVMWQEGFANAHPRRMRVALTGSSAQDL